jgi:AP-2 complex subunit mu-1
MISSIVIVNAKGEILIYRVYKDDITRQETVQFCTKIVATKENKESPIVNIDGTSFIHISHKDIILLATTKTNVNAAMTIQFLYQLVTIFKAYFGGDLDENRIRKHFVLIYEILDEVMDYGIPQILDPDLLKKYIQEGGFKVEQNSLDKMKQLTTQATGVTSWRTEGIKYKKNEVYIDVIENVNLLMSNKGTILRADVNGQIVVKCHLSDMPECKFGMNDKLLMQKEPRKAGASNADKGITIDDLKFHQCVRLGKFDKERAITFIPPDGVFELMTYRITENVNLPFKVIPVINEYGTNRIEARIKLKSIFEKNLFATNVSLKVPCPKNTAIVNTNTSGMGRAKYEPDQGGIIWRIKKYPGELESLLRCEITLSTTGTEKQWVKPPITMEFQVPMFTASGLRVRFLRVYEKSGYRPTKWIRYITKGGDYQNRL